MVASHPRSSGVSVTSHDHSHDNTANGAHDRGDGMKTGKCITRSCNQTELSAALDVPPRWLPHKDACVVHVRGAGEVRGHRNHVRGPGATDGARRDFELVRSHARRAAAVGRDTGIPFRQKTRPPRAPHGVYPSKKKSVPTFGNLNCRCDLFCGW